MTSSCTRQVIEAIRLMTWQSMARVSSASPEADFAPAIQTPFDWEAAPGRAARKSSKNSGKFYGNSVKTQEVDEGPSLPLPPGRRPKDGFYLPYSREFVDSYPELQSSVESGGNSGSKPRKLFNLKFPGSSRKSSPISRMHLPFQSSSKPPKASHVDEDQAGFRIFNPLSGQRLANRMLMQIQKKQSLWRRCLPSKPGMNAGASSSYIGPNRGRRLDEGLDDSGYVNSERDSLPCSPRPRTSSNCSPVHVNSSRFMASMLISLCPDDAGDSDRNAEDGNNSDDYNEEIGIPHLTTPRNKSSSPESAFEVEMDPASQVNATTSQELQWTCTCRHRVISPNSARVESPIPQRGKTVSRSLHEEFATARSPSEHSRSGNLRSRGNEDSANKFNYAADQEDSADGYPVRFSKASSTRELFRSKETSYISSFSWKPCTEKNQSVADIVEPRDSDEPIYDDEDDDDGEEYEQQGRVRIFSTGAHRSSSPEFNSVWPRSKDIDTVPVPISKFHSKVGYLSPPRISFEDLEFTSNSDGQPKAFARWRSTAAPSVMRRTTSLQAERKPRVANVHSVSPLQRQVLQPSQSRIKQTAKAASPLRPTVPSKAQIHGFLHDTDDSGDDESNSSTDSSGYETVPPAVSSTHNFASPKLLAAAQSPKLLLKPNSRISPKFMAVDHEAALPGPSFQRIIMARSHSVRSSSSRRFTPTQESCQADSNLKAPSHQASRLAKTSSSSVMSKVALFESKAGLVSKSGPLLSSVPGREPTITNQLQAR